MLADIWTEAGGDELVVPLCGDLVRVVESQEQVATSRLVGSLEEQALLESLLEIAKPPLPEAADGLHYLLATPFRYPPLRHGSRFGGRLEPSLFYGAVTAPTALAESAYYRLVFWHGMTVPPASPLKTQHTLFGAPWRCGRGVRLQANPFERWRDVLVDPSDYAATQRLGSAMRAAGIEAFEYMSARDTAGGVNIALFTPSALAAPRPTFTQGWFAETSGAGVRFYSAEERVLLRFPIEQFLVAGQLPMPAA